MITESILSVLLIPIEIILEFIPDFDWVVSAEIFTILNEFFAVICYIIPMDTVVEILLLIVAINLFKIGISLIKTLWQLIPFT